MPATNIKELFSYRLNVLANLSSSVAALQNRRRFGLSRMGWRIVGLLACVAPMTLNRLALETHLDKASASRLVADLLSRRLIKRKNDENDGRGISLELSP